MKRLLLVLVAVVALAASAAAGAFAEQPVRHHHHHHHPAPVGVTVENSVFLCYSTYQVDPGAWKMSVAETLYDGGYWQPFAVAGNVAGGTNIGAYHLVCNLATGQSVPTVHGYVGGGGTVVGADMHKALEETLGFYEMAS